MRRETDYKKDLKYVPHHKTGIKLLDTHQLENLFPNYERLLDRIEEHRRQLKRIEKDGYERDSQYNLMYDNIFSIFGKRGAGKTSAMFTLKKILETKNEYDIVLPIVMPEMIPQECSMIGWILSLLEEIVDELDSKMNDKMKDDDMNFGDCMYRQKNTLKREYEKVKELCFSQFYQSEGIESFSTALINKERQTQNSFNFSKRLGKFWDLLKQTIQKVNSQKGIGEPLLYIIFDDVDLLPEAVTTLLSTIIKYLSHPNIIVFVTADEELLYDVIENNMNEKLRRHRELKMYSQVIRALSASELQAMETPESYFQEVQQKMQMSRQIPRLYADKVLPPSSRYYLKTYETYEDKSMFIERVERYQKAGKQTEILITLEEVFKQEIKRYVKAVCPSEKNFLINQGKFIKAYFAFWGNTSRQLVNEALILHEFVTKLIDIDRSYKAKKNIDEKYSKELYESIYAFAYNSITAMGNSELSGEEIKKLLEELIVYKTGNWSIYLNYSYLREHVEAGILKNNNLVETVQQTVSLCVLLYFLENILVIESKSKPNIQKNKREAIHGRGILVDVLDRITAAGYSLVCKSQAKDVNELLQVYEKILISPEIIMNFDLMDPRKVRRYLNELCDANKKADLAKYSRENPKWFKSIAKILYFSNEGIYEIQKREILLRKLNDPACALHDSYYEESLRELRDDLVKALSKIPHDLDKKWLYLNKVTLKDEKKICKSILEELNLPDNNNVSLNWEIEKIYKNGFGAFKEIEKEIIKKISNYSIENSEFINEEMYLRVGQENVGAAARTDALLEALEIVGNRLLNYYGEFKFYEIIDIEKFKETIKRLDEFDIVVPVKTKYLDKEITISDMNRIFSDISNEIGKFSWNKRYGRTYSYQSNYREIIELEDIYTELYDCTALALKNVKDVERAIKIVLNTHYFKTLQKYYLWFYLKSRKEKPMSMRIDYTTIPYRELYAEINQELQKADGSYLTSLLRRYIEEAVTQYVDKLMEG